MKSLLLFLLVSLTSICSFAQISKIESDSIKRSNAKSNRDSVKVAFTSFTIFFPTGEYKVEEKYLSDLKLIATQVTEAKDSIKLFGYTDSVGDSLDNYELSRLRSESIQTFFLEAGVSSTLMKSYFFGENSPKADNNTSQGRAQNRRVEIKIIPKRKEVIANPEPQMMPDTTKKSAPSPPTEEKQVSPIDLTTLNDEITMPANSKMVPNKSIPVVKKETPVKLNSKQRRWTTSNGSTIMIGYDYSSGDAPPEKLLVQVNGASGFFDIPVNRLSLEGNLNVPIGFPTDLDKGTFDIIAVLVTKKRKLSKPDTTTVEVERLGTGKLQISLSWDAETDQDLYVKTPGREVISFLDYRSSCGGFLDRDDTDGFGPENIYWEDDAPNGSYTISVDDYENSPRMNSFIITINGMGVERQFSGTTQYGSKVQVVKFKKKGNEIIWQQEDLRVIRSGKK